MLRMLGFSLYLLLHGYTGAGRSVGPPTCVGGREGGGGGGGVRPFLFSTENSHIVAYSLPVPFTAAASKETKWTPCPHHYS